MTPLALTMGDPAGIGPELTVAVWRALRASGPVFFWLGDPALLDGAVPLRAIGTPEEAEGVFREALPVLPVACDAPVVAGKPDSRNAPAVIASIERATRFALEGRASAVVTNPIAKHVLAETGFGFPGHTEFLASLCGVSGQEVMMLAAPELRVVPVTVHVSLRRALDMLSAEAIVAAGRTTAAALRRDFGIAAPRLAVAGLNPHAGEHGLMGGEEGTIIAPAIAALRAEGIRVSGPLPPDTMFSAPARPGYDAAICMYHDQALIPLKTLDMAGGVNVTLGLPIVRTSPDHGTAFDIASTPGASTPGASTPGKADPSSLLAAIRLAAALAFNRGGAS